MRGNILPPPSNVYFSSLFRKIATLLLILFFNMNGFRTYAQCTVTNITGHVVWNTNMNIFNEIRIQNGATLSITGNIQIVFWNNSCGIVVEPGGYLNINDGAVLKPRSGLWKGIYARSMDSGGVQITNSTIERAQIGVHLEAYLPAPPYIWYSASIYANNATFLNNQVAIHQYNIVSPYYANPSHLINCSFITNISSPLQNPVKYIDLIASDVFNITGCTFTNNTSGSRLVYAIVIDHSNREALIDDCTFNNVERGVYITGNSVVNTVKYSSFNNIPGNTTPIVWQDNNGWWIHGSNYGIMAVATKAKVQDNNFDGDPRISINHCPTYGTVFDNTGSGGSIAFRNNYQNIDYGFQSQKDNTELVVSCNHFIGFQPDPSATLKRYGWLTQGGTGAFMRDQGTMQGTDPDCSADDLQAGNEWSTLCVSSTHDVDIRVNGTIVPFYYASHTILGSTGQEQPKPNCSTSGWRTTYLKPCLSPSPGYSKGPNSCDAPFAYPPGVWKTGGSKVSILDDPEKYFDAAEDYISSINTTANSNAYIYFRGAMQWASNEVVTKLLTAGDERGAIDWLGKSPLAEDARALCEIYLRKRDFASAEAALTDYLQKVSGSIQQHAEYSDYYNEDARQYAELIRLVIDIYTAENDVTGLTDEQQASLDEFVKLTSETGVRARSFIRLFGGEMYFYEPMPVTDDAESHKTSFEQIQFKIYPNPSDGFFRIEYEYTDEIDLLEFVLTDLAGKEVAKINLPLENKVLEINSAHFQKGIYLYSILENGRQTQAGKLVFLN